MSSGVSSGFAKSDLIPDTEQMRRLHNILRSNSLPPETSSFRHVLHEAPGELARYATEIERLQAIVADLITDRDTLASYAAGCRSIFSPARRIPAELLVEIFDMSVPLDAYELFNDTTPERELERLAKKDLLDISQVCSRWHGVIIDTPRLWAAFAIDTTLWSRGWISPQFGLELVATLLQRSAGFPLAIQIAVTHGGIGQELIELLVQHSHRWKAMYFWMDPRCFEFLAAVKGHLPILERLKIHGDTNKTHLGIDFDAFEIAPRLTRFDLRVWPSELPIVPWGQLVDITYDNQQSPNLSNGLELMRSLSTASRYTLYVKTSSVPLPVDLPFVTSKIAKLIINTAPSADLSRAQGVLAAILNSVTLPSLKSLRFLVEPKKGPLFWTHTSDFMAFASRSSLDGSLTYLEIRAVIQDDELLQCLSVLPLLEILKVYDCEDVDGGHAVVTDKLLHRLSWGPPQDNLIPHLNFVLVASLCRFQDAVFENFTVSRIIPGRRGNKPFEIRIRRLPTSERQISAKFRASLTEFIERGELKFFLAK